LNLALGTTYYWQVFAVNGTSRTAADGGTWHSFTTWASAPSGTDFAKLLPADKETDVSLTPWLYWAAPTAGSNFEYCFAATSFANTDTCGGNWTAVSANTIIKLPNTAFSSALTHNTTYYWQVRYPKAGGGYNYADNKPFSFTTVNFGPSAGNVNVSIAEDTVLNQTLTATSNYSKAFEILGALPAGLSLDASFAANGKFSYTPAANFNGTASFLYEVSDGINQPVGPYTVTITVTGVNDAPVISPIILEQASYLPGDTIIEVIDVNDPDIAYGDTISFAIVGSLPNGATFDAQNGVFVWTIPDTQAAGTVPVSFKATDSANAFNTTTMNIVIAGIPVTGGGGSVFIPLVSR
jgi:hypothetical protein